MVDGHGRRGRRLPFPNEIVGEKKRSVSKIGANIRLNYENYIHTAAEEALAICMGCACGGRGDRRRWRSSSREFPRSATHRERKADE